MNRRNWFNQLAKTFFLTRKTYENEPVQSQYQFIDWWLKRCRNTIFWQYRSTKNLNHTNFSTIVPIHEYADLEQMIIRQMKWEKKILVPDEIVWFAKTAWTTWNNAKFLPVTQRCLNMNHFRWWQDFIAYYLRAYPESQIFTGKSVVVWWAFHQNPYSWDENVWYISAILQRMSPQIGQMTRFPSDDIAFDHSWEKKLDYICKYWPTQRITSMWWLTCWAVMIFEQLLQTTWKSSIEEIWPHFEVYFSWWMKVDPFLPFFKQMFPSWKLKIWNVYNASEWFFGIQSEPEDMSLLLLTNHWVYYEFIPFDLWNRGIKQAISLEFVEKDIDYVLLITTTAWLWRYVIWDVIRFVQIDPYKFNIVWRTKYRISTFDECFTQDDADYALTKVCDEMNCVVRDYHIAPLMLSSSTWCHERVIEFEQEPSDYQQFNILLDKYIREHNEDYDYIREWDIALMKPVIHIACNETFYRWLQLKGKLWGQNKVPKLSITRDMIEELLLLQN